jgi:hypothetical protein
MEVDVVKAKDVHALYLEKFHVIPGELMFCNFLFFFRL